MEGWIHSNRRNSLGSVVCRATREHSHQHEVGTESGSVCDGLLPWDIEMTVEEPVSDDEDGSPHRVSDSESESESEQDSEYFFV
jgi:hypothetical protein